MGDFRISGKNVITQSGTDEPVLASNVTLGTGIIKPGAIPNAATSTLSCTTASSTTITTADTSSLSLGMAVSGTGIPSGAHIATIPNSTTFTISAAATNSATNTLTFRTGITDSKLNFAGTVDNTTFLRSDKTWATAGSPSITDGGNATAITINSDEEVTFEKRSTIPSIKPKSNRNLTGTYADHEMIMGDKFTLTGNLTINDNLVLASLSGSGQDIIIEDDGNGRTITTAGKVISCTTTNSDATVTTADTSDFRAGTGVTGTGIPSGATIASVTNATTFELSAAATASGTVNLTFDTAVFEAGEFLGTAGLPSLTDLSGTLGSGVTLGSNVSFPSGMMINCAGKMEKILADEGCGSSTALSSNFFQLPITSRGANSKFMINITAGKTAEQNTNAPGSVWLSRTINGSLSELTKGAGVADRYLVSHTDNSSRSHSWVFWDEPAQAAGTLINYQLRYVRNAGSGDTFYLVSAYAMGAMTIQEIAA